MSDQTCSNPCGGACCRAFLLNVPANAIASRVAAALRAIGTPDETEADRDDLEWLPHVHEHDDTPGTYRCDLLDEATGRCTVYATRPRTCREYPAYEPKRSCHCGFALPSLATPETTKAASS